LWTEGAHSLTFNHPQPNYWPSGSSGNGQGAFIWGTGPTQCVKVNYPTPPDLVPNGAGIYQPPGTQGAAGNYFLYTPYRPTYQPFYADQVCYSPRTLDFYPGWARYAAYFGIAANTVTGCNGPQTPEQSLWARPYWGPTAKAQNVISGPGWGNLLLGANNITDLINLSKGCFWNEATVRVVIWVGWGGAHQRQINTHHTFSSQANRHSQSPSLPSSCYKIPVALLHPGRQQKRHHRRNAQRNHH